MDEPPSSALSPSDSAVILVVEDNEAQRELVNIVLKDKGHIVLAAENLEEARAALAENPVALVLCDIYLEEQASGTDLLRELAPRSPDVAVVMVTGATDTQTAINCLREGAFDYLLKPYTPKDLTFVVQSSLERREKQISARREMHQQMEMLAKFASESPDPVLRLNPEGQVLYANRAGLLLVEKWEQEEGAPVPASLKQVIAEACQSGTKQQLEISGNDKAFSFTVAPIRGAAFAYLYGHDITVRIKAEQELIELRNQAEWMALHDSLTELPNRKHFEQKLHETVERSSEAEEKMALVFLDLDNFKYINDLYGHKTGDRALLFVADFFREVRNDGTLTEFESVGRWGGDELVLILTGVASHEEARDRCKRLKDRLHATVSEKLQFPLATSMGVALFPDDATEPTELLHQADTALYIAKSRGPNSLATLMEQAPGELLLRDKARLASRLTKAVKNKEIQVHYQPILCAKTRTVVAAEALARWEDPKLGWISCGAFIPMAEESGLINELGRQVAVQSLQQLHRWRSEGLDLTLSLNSSLRQTSMPSFGTDLLQLVKEAGVDPEHVTIEITERELIMEAKGIDRFAEHGFRLAIDDFGSGYSSLSELLDMSVHEIKIDRALTEKVQTEKGRCVMETVIKLGQILDISLVVEGLEDEETSRIVCDMGVEKLQGYYFSHPLPAEEFFEQVKHGKLSDAPAMREGSV